MHRGRKVKGWFLNHAAVERKFKNSIASVTGKRITFHDLRRTAAVRMYEQPGDLRTVQALLGHRNLQSTLWYLDHDFRPVSRETLELIKYHPWCISPASLTGRAPVAK
jgi:integrase